MILSSTAQQRARHINSTLAKTLSSIEREHSRNLITYEKLENAIRRDALQAASDNRTKISTPFHQIYGEQTGSMDYHHIRYNNLHSSQKHRSSFGTASTSSIDQYSTSLDRTDEFSEDTASSNSLRRRRFCTKAQRLPPIVKSTVSNQPKRDKKNDHWIASFQRTKEELPEPFTAINNEDSKSLLPELTPIQRQVRSFLETLPAYEGILHGFDNFAPASLCTNPVPVAIR